MRPFADSPDLHPDRISSSPEVRLTAHFPTAAGLRARIHAAPIPNGTRLVETRLSPPFPNFKAVYASASHIKHLRCKNSAPDSLTNSPATRLHVYKRVYRPDFPNTNSFGRPTANQGSSSPCSTMVGPSSIRSCCMAMTRSRSSGLFFQPTENRDRGRTLSFPITSR